MQSKGRFFLIRTMSKPLSADAALRPPHFSQTVSCQEKEELLPAVEGEEKYQGSCAAWQAWLLWACRSVWQPGLARLAGDGLLPRVGTAYPLLGSPSSWPSWGAVPLQAFNASFLLFFLFKNNCFDSVNRRSIHMAQVPRAVKGFCPIPTASFAFLGQPVHGDFQRSFLHIQAERLCTKKAHSTPCSSRCCFPSTM